MKKILMKKINSLDWEEKLSNMMTDFFSQYVSNSAVVNVLSTQVIKTMRRFEDGQYHFLPVYDDSFSDDTYMNIIFFRLENNLEKYAFLFNEFENEVFRIDSLSIKSTLDKDENRSIDITKERGGSNSKTETNSGTDTTVYTGGSNGMSENSPINADINSINTPNIKSISATDGTTTYERGGIKETVDVLGEENKEVGTDNLKTIEKRFSPYEYDMYIKSMQNLNVLTIITNCIKKVIKEFNCSI